MRGRNNLTDSLDNSLFEVRDTTHAYVVVAAYPSSTHFTANKPAGRLWAHVELVPGDLVADLLGGVFVVGADRTLRPARSSVPEPHPFYRRVEFDGRWDTARLAGPSPWDSTVFDIRHRPPVVESPGGSVPAPAGSGDNRIVPGTHLLTSLDSLLTPA